MAEATEEKQAGTEGDGEEHAVEPELKQTYADEVRPRLKEELDRDNIMGVPELKKITVNMGLGDVSEQRDRVEWAKEDLALITGQQPVVTRAHKSIAGFNIREGDPVGVKVTLRGDRMYAFLERLITIVIPRIKDFSGLDPDAMDGQGNFSMGIDEQGTFPGIDVNEVSAVQGMDVTITTSADDDEAGRTLLTELGMPFREE